MSSYHGWTHRPKAQGGTDPTEKGNFEIKVFSDLQVTVTGDGKFIFLIPKDLGGTVLHEATAYVSTNGSTFSRVQIRNVTQAVDLLSTRIRIDASERSSYTSSVPTVITAALPVAKNDLIAVDVDDAGTGSKGLGVILVFA